MFATTPAMSSGTATDSSTLPSCLPDDLNPYAILSLIGIIATKDMVTREHTQQTTRSRKAVPEREPEFAELVLGDFDELGDTTAEFEGQTINVAGGMPGERAIVRIYRYRRRRKNRVSGIVDSVLSPSPDRVKPRCGYYGRCSGCQWQHIDYTAQLELKRQRIVHEFAKYESLKGIPVADTLAAPSEFYYRNHARFTIRRGGQLGFSNRITRHFVRVEHCMLMSPAINEMATEFQDRAGETSNMSIRVGVNTGDFLVQPTFQNPDIGIASGQTHYSERMDGTDLRIASPSFFQVNTAQAGNLIDIVKRRLDLQPDHVLIDAYAGVGVFAILLAPYVERSIAIEESASAVADGKLNAEGTDNVEFVQLKTEEALTSVGELCGLDGTPIAVILDPPRVGCHPEALKSLLELGPDRVAYVSCDPPSLARDLNVLARGEYLISDVQPIDMFPQTYHVESVTTLTRGP